MQNPERDKFIGLATALWHDAQEYSLCAEWTLENYLAAALEIYDNQEAKNATHV
jgi:hypothetical protein